MRRFHSSARLKKNPYYFYDIQCQHITPSVARPRTFNPLASLSKESMSERVSKVFGEMGSRDESKKVAQAKGITVAGIKVPSRPEEPTNCCMSGCVNCVWELYKDEIEEWKELRNKARKVLMQPKYADVKWPELLGAEPQQRKSRSHGSEAEPEISHDEDQEDDAKYGLNTGIKVFIETEKRIHARKQARMQHAN